MDLVEKIEALFIRGAEGRYEIEGQDRLSVLEHALQCAQLAEWAHADAELVAAALLHDLGLLIDVEPGAAAATQGHESAALGLLAQGFGPGVLEPIRLHVQAKRYLVGTEPGYEATLSRASRESLAHQGGRMNAEERLFFLAQPYASEALQLRRWDDLAQQPGKRTPPLAYYLDLLDRLLRDQSAGARLLIA